MFLASAIFDTGHLSRWTKIAKMKLAQKYKALGYLKGNKIHPENSSRYDMSRHFFFC